MPFLLGPLGGLRVLPSPHLGQAPDATASRIGAVHRSLTGRVTVDRLAVRRVWTLIWPYLAPDTYTYLDALHQGLATGPLWLIDPTRPNRLAPQIAATGGADRSPAGFTASAGALTWTAQPVYTGIPLPGMVLWGAPAAASRLDATPVVPLLAGEAVTFAAHVSTARPIRLTLTTLSASGSEASVHQGEVATPGVNGARLAITATPPATAVSCRLGISTDTAAAASAVATTAWQLQPALTSGPWSLGGGAAQVVVDSLTVAYPVPGSFAVTLTLLEV